MKKRTLTMSKTSLSFILESIRRGRGILKREDGRASFTKLRKRHKIAERKIEARHA